ncbi:MAG: hypothetical protein L0215_22805 [Gemmataceae bacterium]|nr:hypothetical protein [Gemmataceae bacterium]
MPPQGHAALWSVPVPPPPGQRRRAVLPSGEVKVCVDNRELEPTGPIDFVLPPGLPPEVAKALQSSKSSGQASKSSNRFVRIPEKYHDIETSDLKFTVQGGDQKHDIELKK